VLACAFHAYPAHAQGIPGFLDNLQTVAQSVSGQWMTNSLTYAAWLTGVVAVTSGIGLFVSYYARNSTIDGITYPATELLFRLIPPIVMLKVAQNFLPGVFAFAGRLATGITGVPISGPGAIYVLGVQRAADIIRSSAAPMTAYLAANPVGTIASTVIPGATFFTKTPALTDDLTLYCLGGLAGLILIGAFTLMAAELLLSAVNVLIVLSVGAVQIGWQASQSTQQMAAAYWQGVLQAVFRIVILYAVASFISTAALTAFNVPGTTVPVADLYANAFQAIAFALASCYLVLKIPHMADNVFSGRAVLVASDAMVMASRHVTQAINMAGRAGAVRA
jgi:hypothetical protein